MEYEDAKRNLTLEIERKKLELAKEFKDIEINRQKIENEEKLQTVRLNNYKQIELQKIENEKNLFNIELENQKKLDDFVFDFLNKMIEQNKSPEEIIIARNILLYGVQNKPLVNLYG